MLPKWNALVSFIRHLIARLQQMTGPGIRRQVTGDGFYFIADLQQAAWPHPWRVSVSDLGATIERGTLENIVPMIDGVRIDGSTDTGGPGHYPAPILHLKDGPGDSLRSFVCLECTVLDETTGEIDPASVIITHRQTLEAESELTGIKVLAELIWSDAKTVRSVFDVAMFNLQHEFEPASDGGAARHVFSPAA